MKLISKKDIVIPKGTVFRKRNEYENHHWSDCYDVRIDLGKSITGKKTSARILVSDEDREYFNVVEIGI